VELEKLNDLEKQRAPLRLAHAAPGSPPAADDLAASTSPGLVPGLVPGLRATSFLDLKGHLQLPVPGKIVSQFGRLYDPTSRLYIFKKGVDIAPGEGGRKLPVRAVSKGRIAYSGELPDYGRVAIIDHGGHFYTLCAHLGELTRKAGEEVSAGDAIGATGDSGTPVYFEIRSRNVAVNPLQWLAN
jgi:septal ring factor EnvC (AmiA/AmiB activator)